MKQEKLFTVQIEEHLVREIKVSAVDDADAIKMATELLQNNRVKLSRENNLDYDQISICGVEE